jgi:hypothetical protein
MSVCVVPDISFTVGSIDLLLQFCIQQDDGSGTLVPIPDASTATVTWISPSGQRRPLSPVAPISAIFGWVTSAMEFRTPHTETGRCLVSAVTGGVFWTEPFSVEVLSPF